MVAGGILEILTEIPIELDPEKITRAIFREGGIDDLWRGKVAATVGIIKPLLQPRALLEWLEVERVDDNSLVLAEADRENKINFKMGPHAELYRQAQMVLRCVATLGDALDSKLETLNQSSDVLSMYLTDCVGIYGLLQVSRAVYTRVEQFAGRKQWGTGWVMSPGAVEGWELEEQKAFCSYLGLDKIGVRLNDSGVLSPHKSVSFMVGVGPGYMSQKVEPPCRICTNTGVCWCIL